MPNEATTPADTLHRHGDPDPSEWQEAEAVTGRPNDEASPNSTMADRAKARKQVDKDSDVVEDKAITKAPAKKAAASKKAK